MEDDYELFGLDKNNVSKKDATKAYYNMALLVHPDRNACLDRDIGTQEMINVTNAYNRIMCDIESINENKIICESKDLTEYQKKELSNLDKITKEMPSFMDIYIETHDDIKKFNKAWENRSIEKKENDYLLNSSTGYNTVKSEYADLSFENLSYSPYIVESTDELTKFTKPKTEIISIDELSSFNNINTRCFDYKEAFGIPEFLVDRIPSESIEKFNNEEDLELAFEKKCKEMDNIFI
uniref:J domain-containing protein n=1 Tax=viral metagenome TaxID=1070528 RepID=A0A6C0L211_9ZZZZ|tara:strand:+ start:14559 stop:15272 length:714 start_codon:yes stop_codon:yes gene_type:complete